jgi:hypothetical protein
MSLRRAARTLASLALLTACATAGTGGGTGAGDPGAGPPSPSSGSTGSGASGTSSTAALWPVKTREHIDLWLHSYALVQDDTAQVPFFQRGYRDRLVVVKNQANVVTALDRARDTLRLRLAQNPGLVGGQFLPLAFASWDDMRRAIELFVEAQGSVQRARTQQEAAVIQLLANYFPGRPDREWAGRFAAAVEDERAKFYHDYWLRQQRERATALAATDAAWQQQYRPKLQRYLNNTQQQSGELILSLPLDGEGRSAPGSTRENVMVVAFPAQAGDAAEVAYVVAHEAIAKIASVAIADYTTPTQKREGAADRLASPAAVRGGLLLLERAAPELADGYARYYLRSANRPSTGPNPRAALAAAFPLQSDIRDAMARQLDVVLGGI